MHATPKLDVLFRSIEFLARVVRSRMDVFFGKIDQIAVDLPQIEENDSTLSQFIRRFQANPEELLTLLLALAPHLQPDFFTDIIKEHFPDGGDFPAFGGVKGTNHRGILPTGETAQFVLAGNDLAKRLEVQEMFSPEHWFARERVLWLESVGDGEPAMSGRIILDQEWVEKMTIGRVSAPRFSTQFPAERLHTEMDWSDLVLPDTTLAQIREIEIWVRHHRTLLHDWGMSRKLKPGYRALFHGPPGTGKTLTATLLGKQTGREVFRIDLSLVVSKFIGETEKNLAALFDKAQNKEWILFFDEADALFGKRTDVRDAHDKYANQEVSFLLQRVENFPGLVILASNFKSNIDDAFMRRFQSVVYFPMPRPAERRLLWEKAIPREKAGLDGITLDQIAQRYELSGASILNVVQFCCLRLLENGDHVIREKDIQEGAARELGKEGKIIH